MYWQEKQQPARTTVDDAIVDVVYGITCARLPVDHAYALSEQIQKIFPWFADEPGAALHTIHVAASGNGWIRPGDFIHPSRRSKLALRLPQHRLAEANKLTGQTLDIDGHELKIGSHTLRPLSTLTTIFARYVETGTRDEQQFMKRALEQLRALGITPKKMMCGVETLIRRPDGELATRSLMLAELSAAESLQLQQRGLGPHRNLGCGVFIPHKGIQDLNE